MKHIRNFSIIAHIDHGKSTLADRLLEYTGILNERTTRPQILDNMELERERGITIKAKSVRMDYVLKTGEKYVLNLIDTPGHVDFSYEVARSLDACEGCLLVVDATQGVEAQTLANAELAKEKGLYVIPVLNKIDLSQANVEESEKQIQEILGITEKPILASAKEGIGIKEILESIVMRIPFPKGNIDAPLSALIFDSFYDPFRGVILYLRIIDGVMNAGMKIQMICSGKSYEVLEIGYLQLKMNKSDSLKAGEVGYCVAGIKDIHQIRIGDTITDLRNPTTNYSKNLREVKPFVFSGLYPASLGDFGTLQTALEKLHLTDSSFSFHQDNSSFLGFGFRCGFLGLLHMDIVKQRLEREFGLELFVTLPNVVYRVETINGKTMDIDNPSLFPLNNEIKQISEPYVIITIVIPAEFMGGVMDLVKGRRGKFVSMKYLTPQRVVLVYELPLAEMIYDFYDKLKSVSKGYASFDYEQCGFMPGDLVKLEILINHEVVDALSFIIHRDRAYSQGKKLVEKLREIIPRQMFEVPLQAQVNNRIISRESVAALRKDVLAKCYGGDITRKRKLLQKQKEGKRKMKQFGKIEIPPEAFLAVLKLEE